MAGEAHLGTGARVGVVCAALLIAVLGVFATARRGGGVCDGEDPGYGLAAGAHPVFDQLALSKVQRRAWIEAWRTHVDGVRPELDQIRELRAKLRVELANESPDAAIVGQYVIAMRRLSSRIGAARADLDASLSGILDDDQQARFRALRAANRRSG